MELTKEYKMGMDYTAKTFAGLEEVLAEELKAIGALDVTMINRGVQFRGDTSILYKANYLCRTALRILKPVGVFKIKDQDELYEKVKTIDWTQVFNLDQTFIVHANVFHSELNHSHYVALKTKDAIVDQFRDKTGKRPWVGKEDAQIYIDVHISHDVCTLSLDSSGESLHRRGYRIETDKAPLSEVLAAGMVKLTGWDGKKDFYDPMCGSGTIPIEAAMASMNIPSGYYRSQFAFMNWASFEEDTWKKVKEEADDKMGELECRIFASDRSEKAIKIAKVNIKNAGLHKDIELSVKYFDAVVPAEDSGILVFNPPYGQRLEESGDIINLYRNIGDVLKQNFQGFVAWVISSNFDAAKFVGLRPSAKLPLFNGPLETKFIKFEMYEGSKKDQYADGDGEQKETPKEAPKDDSEVRKDFRKKEGSDKKEFKRRDEGDRKGPYRRDDKDKRDFRKKDDSDRRGFRRKDEGERKPYRKREESSGGGFRRREEGNGKGFRKRDDGDREDFKKRDGSEKGGFRRRDEGDKKGFRKRDDGDRKDYRKRDDSSGGGFRRRDEDDNRGYRKRDGGDRKEFRKRDDSSGGGFRRREEGDKKGFRKKDDGERKDFRKRDDGERGGFQRRDEGEKRSFKKKDDGDRRDFRKRDDKPDKDLRKRDDGVKKYLRPRKDHDKEGLRKSKLVEKLGAGKRAERKKSAEDKSKRNEGDLDPKKSGDKIKSDKKKSGED